MLLLGLVLRRKNYRRAHEPRSMHEPRAQPLPRGCSVVSGDTVEQLAAGWGTAHIWHSGLGDDVPPGDFEAAAVRLDCDECAGDDIFRRFSCRHESSLRNGSMIAHSRNSANNARVPPKETFVTGEEPVLADPLKSRHQTAVSLQRTNASLSECGDRLTIPSRAQALAKT